MYRKAKTGMALWRNGEHLPPCKVRFWAPKFGLGALGKKSLEPSRIVEAQIPPSGDETGCQNYIGAIGIPHIGCRTKI
ncbi:hypothetical protein TNCV_2731991 [Trichonephila clavipes]|nr:hypothetical protein TNCV_2731991 [Trichonephila clavipes]